MKGRRVEVSRMGPQEAWTAVLRRPAKTKPSALQPNAVPGSCPTAPTSGINNRGLPNTQARPGARITGGRPAQDLPRGVLSKAEMDSRISHLREMGFSEQAACDALGESSWNLNAALDLLFTHGSPMAAPASTNIAACGDVPCSVASANADADTLSTLSLESCSQPDTDATANQSPRADRSTSGSSEHGSEHSPSVQESLFQSSNPFAETHPEPCVPAEQVGIQSSERVSQNIIVSSSEDLEGTQPVTAKAQSNRPLYRLKEAWMETDANQLGMCAGGYVRMWLGTETELGWVYVEEIGGEGRAGWMPSYILEAVQDGHTAVRAVHSCEAHFENQLSLQEGRMYLVDIHSRTEDGWAYAETLQSPEGTKGWIPIMCLDRQEW